MAWREGEQVGPYLLESQIGQGGMATVYKAYHEQLDRHVALKVMHRNFLDDNTFVTRFTREAQLVARLEHPHIVPVYDFDEHDGLPFLVMKYIKGQTLKRKLIKKPLTLEEVLHVMNAVGSALTYAHEHDILHRDVKPSNIVIDADNVPYLADFGLARLASSGESTMSADMLLGTPHYISPEQARGDKDLDNRADIYSLGVVLYELLVGHVPYTGDTPYSIIHDHIYTPLPEPTKINPEIPLAVEAVLYKALEKDRNDRYTTANELVDDLRHAIREANLTELDPSRVSRAIATLALMQEEAVHHVRASSKIDSPVQQTTPISEMTPSTFRTAMLKKKPPRWYEQERVWPIGGCAGFLVILFFACGILLNMSTNIQEMMALSANGAFNAELNLDEVPPEFIPLNIHREDYNGYSIYVAPVRPMSMVEALQKENPEHPLGYLALATRFWFDNNDNVARQTIRDGLVYAEDIPQYLASAAYAAAQYGDTNAAFIYALAAFDVARDNRETFEQIRPLAGEYIYNNVDNITYSESTGFNTSAFGDFNLTDSPVVLFAVARYRLANGVEPTVILRRVNDSALKPEFDLLRAEADILQENPTDALRLLEAILEDDVPEWIATRAQDLIDLIES